MRYLVGFTDDDGGLEALALGRVLARSGEVDLTVASVYRYQYDYPSMARVDVEYKAFLHEQAEADLVKAREFLHDLPGTEYVARAADSPPEGLLDLVEEIGATMLIVGSRRRRRLDRLATGSCSTQLLYASHVPIAIPTCGFKADPSTRLQNVTCAYVASPDADAALEAAAQLARRGEAPLRVVSFLVKDRQSYPTGAGYNAEDFVYTEVRRTAQEGLEAAADTARTGGELAVETVVAESTSYEEVLGDLDWPDVSVIVVGSGRRGRLARVFLGSTSLKILRDTPVPVIVVPRGAAVALEHTSVMPVIRD